MIYKGTPKNSNRRKEVFILDSLREIEEDILKINHIDFTDDASGYLVSKPSSCTYSYEDNGATENFILKITYSVEYGEELDVSVSSGLISFRIVPALHEDVRSHIVKVARKSHRDLINSKKISYATPSGEIKQGTFYQLKSEVVSYLAEKVVCTLDEPSTSSRRKGLKIAEDLSEVLKGKYLAEVTCVSEQYGFHEVILLDDDSKPVSLEERRVETMSCPMCEEGLMEHFSDKDAYGYMCDTCPFVELEAYNASMKDLLKLESKKDLK